MKCLVTGGAGFIGSHLCERLVKEGNDVVCVDDLSTGQLINISAIKDHKKFRFIKADVNVDDLSGIFRKNKFDTVFHYAAVVGVDRTLEKPLTVLNDIFGTRNLLENSRRFGVNKFVFASSSEVYGEPVEIPEVETGHVNAKMPYAVTKLMSEKFLEAYYRTYGLKTCSLRFFNVYGPRQDSSPYGFVVGIFIKNVLEGKSPLIFGDGTQTRDFVYIDDNVSATIVAAKSKKADGEVINIGTGRPMTILDLAEEIIRLCGSKLKPKFLKKRREDVRHRFPDVSKMRALLNFKPEYNLEKGLIKTIEWYKK